MHARLFLSFLFLFYFNGVIQAQTKPAAVSGVVKDRSTKLTVEFATVQLIKNPDSSIVRSAISDKKGRFIIDNIDAGNYILKFSFIGYSTFSRTISIASQQKLNLGTIEIISSAGNMNEVVVTAKKSILNTSIDRKVYSVSQDIMAQSGTASDVLKNIPSVEVDLDGNVS